MTRPVPPQSPAAGLAASTALAAALAASAGCIDAFQGSNVQLDLGPGAAYQVAPGATPPAGALGANTRYGLYALRDAVGELGAVVGSDLFLIAQFEVHPVVDLASPCFIDVGPRVPHPGLHVSQYAAQIAADTGIADLANPPPGATEEQKIAAATAAQRQQNVAALGGEMGIRAITSATSGRYPGVATACVADDPSVDPALIPPPSCTDEASNQRRLALCQAAWAEGGSAGPSYFEGTDRVLTSPLNGTSYGVVNGRNPVNLAPVGGSQFFVPENLEGVDAFAIYVQADDAPAGMPGELAYFGRPTYDTRGVARVHLTSPRSSKLTADLAIFANLDQDTVHF